LCTERLYDPRGHRSVLSWSSEWKGPVCRGTISDTAGLELFQIASSARKQDGLRRCAVWTGELKLGGLRDEQGRGARGEGAVGVREEDDEIYSREEG
jgi:hypothetical protein